MKRHPVVIELEAHAILSILDAKGARVRCLQGAIWITEERDRSDIVLEPGDFHALAGSGRAVMQAMGASRIAVEAPAGRPEITFPVAHQLLRHAA